MNSMGHCYYTVWPLCLTDFKARHCSGGLSSSKESAMLHRHVSLGKNRQTKHWLYRRPLLFLSAITGECKARGVQLVATVISSVDATKSCTLNLLREFHRIPLTLRSTKNYIRNSNNKMCIMFKVVNDLNKKLSGAVMLINALYFWGLQRNFGADASESDQLLRKAAAADLGWIPTLQTLTQGAHNRQITKLCLCCVKTIWVFSPSTAPSAYSHMRTTSYSFKIHYSVMIISCPGSHSGTSN